MILERQLLGECGVRANLVAALGHEVANTIYDTHAIVTSSASANSRSVHHSFANAADIGEANIWFFWSAERATCFEDQMCGERRSVDHGKDVEQTTVGYDVPQ